MAGREPRELRTPEATRTTQACFVEARAAFWRCLPPAACDKRERICWGSNATLPAAPAAACVRTRLSLWCWPKHGGRISGQPRMCSAAKRAKGAAARGNRRGETYHKVSAEPSWKAAAKTVARRTGLRIGQPVHTLRGAFHAMWGCQASTQRARKYRTSTVSTKMSPGKPMADPSLRRRPRSTKLRTLHTQHNGAVLAKLLGGSSDPPCESEGVRNSRWHKH